MRLKNLPRLAHQLVLVLLLGLCAAARGAGYRQIVLAQNAHPAMAAAARLMAGKLGLPETAVAPAATLAPPAAGQIVLVCAPAPANVGALLGTTPAALKHDGYAVVFQNGGAIVYGTRPRSLLFAAGDMDLWQGRGPEPWVRDPAFALRTVSLHGSRPIAEYVAAVGANLILGRYEGSVTLEKTLPQVFAQLSPETQRQLRRQQQSGAARIARMVQECHDADVEYYPLLYGNDLQRWSSELYNAVLKVFPKAQGQPAPTSWETAALCLSDPGARQVLRAYVQEFASQGGDGLYVTFWDHYGVHCQCDRCRGGGLGTFPAELRACVQAYYEALEPLHKKMIVRTWSSGVPHWLGERWVHAPGNGSFGGTGAELWGAVIRDLPAAITIQTKVYNSDCQPDPPFNPLLGQARPHTEIAEWQITGQTTGRFYFPAATVAHTAWTMKKSLALVGPEGGVNLFPGGTHQSNYDLMADIANSINVYAWRQLSWRPDANVDQIWRDWATAIYGPKAAPHVVKALQLSEPAVNRLFSALGLGSDTNSGFPSNIERRETLLKYTNRYYLPEGQKALEPTLENIQRVIAEKDDCLRQIDQMVRELELAKPDMRPEQAAELATRFDWLREFGIVARSLDESLWRFRYLRHLAQQQTTDPEQLKCMAQSWEIIKAHRPRLFRFDPAQKFSCYDVPLGQLKTKPSLGSPISLMRELFDTARQYVGASVPPEQLPPPLGTPKEKTPAAVGTEEQ